MPGSQSLSPQEEQEKLVEEALNVVKTQSFQMKRCLDKNKLMDALKHASNMLGELRTSLLSPKSYYTLYMAVCDELRHLELYLLDEFQKGHRIADLYELVQYAGNIIPRLYLLITVGIVYIKTNEMSRKDILKDLVEMCRGVQHPLRGLFLRNYLLQCTRNVLPDVDVAAQLTGEADSGTVLDSIEFVLLNFAEMNKLWVRMQHQGHSRDRERREQERRELRLLVGTNLVRLAQLETVDVEKYKRLVLPNVLEQVVSCRDAIAQEYLMDCVIQVFPDDFHLQTLTIVLKACIDLHPDVNVKTIIINLIERLSQFATKPDSAGIPSDIQLFEVFSRHVQQAIETRQKLADDDVIALQVALVNLVTKCYPDRLDYVGQVLRNTVAVLKHLRVERVDAATSVGRELKRLLQLPVDFYSNVIRLLELSEPFAQLLGFFDFDGRRTLACYFLNNALENATPFANQQQLEQTAVIIQSLLVDQPDQPPIATADQPPAAASGAVRGGGGPHYRAQAAAMDLEEFNEDQCLVGRWMNLCQATDDEEQYRMIEALKRAIEKGGARRLRYTMPPLVFQCYRLALQLAANGSANSSGRLLGLFQFVHSTVSHFTKQESSLAEVALRLYLQGVLTVNQLCVAAGGAEPFEQCESMAYEFLTQAISIYEEEISDTKQQLQAIQLIIGTLELLQCFAADNRDTLFSQCALTAAKLLKKPDQCRAVMLCSHLFWSGKSKEANGQELRDSKRVLECLKKGFKIAKQCMDKTVQVQLCVELLCRHVYFAVKGSEAITAQSCQQIADQVREALPNLEPSDEVEQITRHFHNTMEYLERKLKSGAHA